MPEGPEIRRITDKLRNRLKGEILLWLNILPNTKYDTPLNRSWNMVQEHFPSICIDLLCVGKQIFFFFENGVVFYGGLGVFGKWFHFSQVTEGGVSSISSYLNGKNHRKFSLNFGSMNERAHISEQVIWYDDTLSQGNFTIGNRESAYRKMEGLGPDLLAQTCPLVEIDRRIRSELFVRPITLDSFTQMVTNPRRQKVPICRWLMNQNWISGIGNYLKSEILYRAGLNPFRHLVTLSEEEIHTLYKISIQTIQEAYRSGGVTHGSFLDPDMEQGYFQLLIYKRKGEMDAEGNRILFVPSRESPDGRGTYYVKEKQL